MERVSSQGHGRSTLSEPEHQRYRSLFEANPSPMWVFDLETLAFLEVNPAAIATYGFSREEFLAMTISDVRPAEDVPNLEGSVTPPAGHDRAGLWQHRRKDGTLMDVEVVTNTVEFAGRPAEVVFARDVIVPLQAQRELVGREGLLSGFLESSPNGVVVVDDEGLIQLVNPAAEEMFGYGRSELLGRSVDMLLPDRLADSHIGDRAAYLAHPVTRPMGAGREVFARRKNGGEFPAEIGLASFDAAGGRMVTAIITDISERAAARETFAAFASRLEALHEIDREILSATSTRELAASAITNLRRVVRCMRAAVSLVDRDGATEVLATEGEGPTTASMAVGARNESARGVSGLTAGRPRIVVDTGAADPDDTAALDMASAGIGSFVLLPLMVEGALIGTLLLACPEPGIFPEEQMAVASEVATQLAIAINQSRLRDELQRRAAELEQRVHERTQDLQDTNAQLDAFAYSVSHDLRAPLRAMDGFSQALLDDYGDALGDEGRDYARRVVGAAQRMDQLIRDLLAYSRMSRAEFELQPLDLARSCRDALAQVRAEIEVAGATVVVDEPMPLAIGHHDTVVQIVANLVANAVKFAVDGDAPHVRVSAEAVGAAIRLSVEDDGIGIEPEFHERIFKAMERLHGPERYPGTGIGLAIVAKGAQRMGGRAGVESEPGRGSIFWVELPAAGPEVATATGGSGGHG